MSSNKTISIAPYIGSTWAFNLFFAIIVFADLVASYKYPGLTMILKPLIMASIMGHYITKANPQHSGFLLALVFALFGDIFLLFAGDLFFKLGLASFLVMQLLYVSYFNRHRARIDRAKLAIITGVILTCIVFLFYSNDRLGENRVYVIVYSFALSTMAIFAVLRSSKFLFGPLALGACLFVISDLTLAWNKFIHAFEGSGILILLTYASAQFLIMNGVIYDEVETSKP